MTITIEAYAPEDSGAVAQFNERIASSGSEYSFPVDPSALAPNAPSDSSIHHDLYVVKDGSTVRGGYALKREHIVIGDQRIPIGNVQIPLSEALLDKRYANLGVAMLRDAMQRLPELYCLGMGGMHRPWPQLLQRMRWKIVHVPFMFQVVRGGNFLRNVRILREKRGFTPVANVLRFTGLAALGGVVWRAFARLRGARIPTTWVVECVPAFDSRVDALQERCRGQYTAFCDRAAAALNWKFLAHDSRLVRLIVRDGDALIGWLVLTRNQLRNHKQFGDLKLGCIVDGLCAPNHTSQLVSIAVRELLRQQVDLIVSNQQSSCWIRALRRHSFASGPTNFVLAVSPALNARMGAMEGWHFNRGDGDGPINL